MILDELTKQIVQFTEELEEFLGEKSLLLTRPEYTEDAEMKQEKVWVLLKEIAIDDLRSKNEQCEKKLNPNMVEFRKLSDKA